jgi:hypothetical protein
VRSIYIKHLIKTNQTCFIRGGCVPDLYHFDSDPVPDPAFQFDEDPSPTFHSDVELYPDLTFQFDADPDPVPTTHFF